MTRTIAVGLVVLLGCALAAAQNPPEKTKVKVENLQNPEEVIFVGKAPRCRTQSAWFERNVTGRGTGTNAVQDALAQYRAAWGPQETAVRNDADNWVKTIAQCQPGCQRNGTMTLGAFHGTQDWDINIHVTPITAFTWNTVSYEGVLWCK